MYNPLSRTKDFNVEILVVVENALALLSAQIYYKKSFAGLQPKLVAPTHVLGLLTLLTPLLRPRLKLMKALFSLVPVAAPFLLPSDATTQTSLVAAVAVGVGGVFVDSGVEVFRKHWEYLVIYTIGRFGCYYVLYACPPHIQRTTLVLGCAACVMLVTFVASGKF